jgi:hypothetical protein
MGHISQAWTNLALSQRELRDRLRDGIAPVKMAMYFFARLIE